MAETFYTAGLFLGSPDVINTMQRNFRHVDAMNAHLVKRWNERVNPEDTVFVLGGLAGGATRDMITLSSTLNGRRTLVPGTNDPVFSNPRNDQDRHVYRSLLEAAGWRVAAEALSRVIGIHDVVLSSHPYVRHDSAGEGRLTHAYFDPRLAVIHGLSYRDLLPMVGREFNVLTDLHGFTPVAERQISDWLDQLWTTRSVERR